MPSSSTTTSWPSSTRRLARSIASSATIVWSLAGRSNVEEMTSPLIERSKSVTSSGRSSTRTTIRWHSGLLVVIDVRDRLHDHRLAGLGRRHDQAALALADRRGDVDDAADQVGRLGLEAQPLVGVERGQLGELDAVLGRLGVGAVDGVDAHHRVELLLALALTGLAHLADDRVAAAQAVLADHRQRDVDVVGAGQVAAGADERVVVEHVEDARGRDEDVVLEDRGVGLVALATGLRGGCRGRGPDGDGCGGCPASSSSCWLPPCWRSLFWLPPCRSLFWFSRPSRLSWRRCEPSSPRSSRCSSDRWSRSCFFSRGRSASSRRSPRFSVRFSVRLSVRLSVRSRSAPGSGGAVRRRPGPP